jgi:hypothetical protein
VIAGARCKAAEVSSNNELTLEAALRGARERAAAVLRELRLVMFSDN